MVEFARTNKDVIKSVSDNQTEIINNIFKLYIPDRVIDLDPTYSKGNFYKKTNIDSPKLKFDLYPQTEDTVECSADNLPLEDCSVNTIMYDPPFVVGTPNSSKNTVGSNIITNRFGSFKNIEDLWRFYDSSLKEFSRIIKPGGVLIVKCQDTISSSKQYLSHIEMINYGIRHGFYCKDLFIQTTKNRILSGKHKTQVHARKYHCYWVVFTKEKNKVNYNNFWGEKDLEKYKIKFNEIFECITNEVGSAERLKNIKIEKTNNGGVIRFDVDAHRYGVHQNNGIEIVDNDVETDLWELIADTEIDSMLKERLKGFWDENK